MVIPSIHDFVPAFRIAATSALKILLQERHLYQRVQVDREWISPHALQVFNRSGRNAFGSSRTAEQIQQTLAAWGTQLIDHHRWSPVIGEGSMYQEGHAVDVPLPTIVSHCSGCKAAWPHKPEDSILPRQARGLLLQWWQIEYQCQHCSSKCINFLVKRESGAVKLVGRDPISHYHVPTFIPKNVRHHLSSALVANQAGQVLAGIFYLRTFIEQHWRGVLKLGNQRLTGDEMADQYNATLDSEIKTRIPSLGVVYDRLSNAMHEASVPDQLFENSHNLIVTHFEALRMLERLAEISGNKIDISEG